MNVLLINCGSSSVKIEVIQAETAKRFLVARLKGITGDTPTFTLNEQKHSCPSNGHEACLDFAIPLLQEALSEISLSGIVHRVVHGGAKFSGAC